jgi:tetratricopeptide (TPR) repeat protein
MQFCSKRQVILLSWLLVFLLIGSSQSFGQKGDSIPPSRGRKPTTPWLPKKDTAKRERHKNQLDELIKVMEASKLTYDYQSVPDSVFANKPAPQFLVLNNKLHVVTENGVRKLVEYPQSDGVKQYLDEINKSNKAKNYQSTLENSRALLEFDSTFGYARTLIGDAFFLLQEYDSAIAWFKKSIKFNYADFQAHWYLADAYLRKNDSNMAVKELTIAHLLNINDGQIRISLIKFRKELKRPMNEKIIVPLYEITKQADTVTIRYPKRWEGYALAKAVWAYEPGYAQAKLGKVPDTAKFRMLEEMEAMVCEASTDSTIIPRLNQIINEHFFQEFMLYEIAGPRYPEWIATLPENQILRLADYIDLYR